RANLQDRLPSSPKETALGRDAYVFFLKNVALYPFSPGQILAMGQQEWNRAVAFESYEKERNKNVPPLQLAKDTDSWIKDAAVRESQIREFLDKHRSEEHTSELQSRGHLVCRLLLEKKKKNKKKN